MMGTEFGRSGADAPSGHSAEPEPSSTVSAVPVSVPNAKHDWSVAVTLKRNDGTGDIVLGHMIVEARTEADAIGTALALAAKSREGEHPLLWSAIPLASAIEARRAETPSGSVADEHAVANSETPTPSSAQPGDA